MVKIRPRRATFLLAIVPILLFVSGCGSPTPAAGVTYTPPFAPVTFAIDTNGNISVQGNISIATPIGTFGLEANVAESLQPEDTALLLIIRHKQNGTVVDTVYKIQTGQDEVIVVSNGTTTTDVTQHKVFVNVSNGNIQSIEVKSSNSENASTSLSSIPTTIPTPTSTPLLTVASRLYGTIDEYQNSTTYQVYLEISKTYPDGNFEGKWHATINGSDEDVLVKGVVAPFSESSKFSQISQDKVQQLQQQYSGSGTILWFTSTSYDVGQDIWLGCEYYGSLQTNGSVQGLWYPPGSDADGGPFQLASS